MNSNQKKVVLTGRHFYFEENDLSMHFQHGLLVFNGLSVGL